MSESDTLVGALASKSIRSDLPLSWAPAPCFKSTFFTGAGRPGHRRESLNW